MKLLKHLTLEDLSRVPVWCLAGGDDDDTYKVEPSALESLTEYDNKVFIVRTKYYLNDNSIMWGYCSPQDDSGLEYTQPVIICGNEHAPLYHEKVPIEREPGAIYRKLRKTEQEIFPLRLRAEVPVDSAFYETIIEYVHVEPLQRRKLP